MDLRHRIGILNSYDSKKIVNWWHALALGAYLAGIIAIGAQALITGMPLLLRLGASALFFAVYLLIIVVLLGAFRKNEVLRRDLYLMSSSACSVEAIYVMVFTLVLPPALGVVVPSRFYFYAASMATHALTA